MTQDFHHQAECLDLLIIGVVKGGTSRLVRLLRESYEGILGPTAGPWHANSEVMWCTPHCPGHSSWGVLAHTLDGAPSSEACQICGLHEARGLPGYRAFASACSQPRCWSEMLAEHFGSSAASDGRRLMAKNPDALFWPHLAAAIVPRAVPCRTKIVALLRNPVDRTLSHFGWYWRKMQASSQSSTAAFEHWLDLSLSAYSDRLQRLLGCGSPEELVRTWRGLCYSLETAQQRARWASFLGLGTSPISALTHDGLAFVKGLPQSVYYPQVLTWRSEQLAHDDGPVSLLRVVQSETLRRDPAAFGRLTSWLGLPEAAPFDASTQPDDDLYSSASHRTKPQPAPLVLERLADFFAPHNRRLFDLLQDMGQPFDESLWPPAPVQPLPGQCSSWAPVEISVNLAGEPSAPPSRRSLDAALDEVLGGELDLDGLLGAEDETAATDDDVLDTTDATPPDVIFLSRTPEVGSAQARGAQISARWPRAVLLGWDNLRQDCASMAAQGGADTCASLTKGKVVVHIKELCDDALRELPLAAHVFDPIDKGADQMFGSLWEDAVDARVSGIIAHNEAHAALLRRKAPAKKIWIVPHHAMPRCAGSAQGTCPPNDDELSAIHRRQTIAVIGGEPKGSLRAQLGALVGGAGEVLYESDLCVVNRGNESLHCLCSLLARASVAVAWDQLGGTDTSRLCQRTTGLSAAECYALKPNERFVNPLSAGVPTVGFGAYPSFREAANTDGRPVAALLAEDVPQLRRRLKALLTNFTAWREARRLGLRLSARFGIRRTVARYEEVRAEVTFASPHLRQRVSWVAS